MAMTFERSPDTDAVVTVLRAVNNDMDYKTIAKQSDLSLKRTKSILPSARRILENEGIIFGAIRGEGLRRLSDSDKVLKSSADKKGFSRRAKVATKRLDTANFEVLSQTDRHIASTNRIVFCIIEAQANAKPEAPKLRTTPLPEPDAMGVIKLVKGK